MSQGVEVKMIQFERMSMDLTNKESGENKVGVKYKKSIW